ncbi:unnamed protein product, partial [marine sediment metagenome]
MKKRHLVTMFLGVLLSVLYATLPSTAGMVTTTWGGDAEIAYDTGFMQTLMKHPDGGVCLFNMDLIENDAPGAGLSEKGVSRDSIWGKNRARKVFHLDDVHAHKAWLVVILHRQGKYPLSFTVNGNQSQFDNWDESKNIFKVRCVEFPK